LFGCVFTVVVLGMLSTVRATSSRLNSNVPPLRDGRPHCLGDGTGLSDIPYGLRDSGNVAGEVAVEVVRETRADDDLDRFAHGLASDH
jgi:hypothetical protein